MPQERKGRVLRFGIFEVCGPARELRKHGTRVRLRGQPFCILSMLLEKPGEVVTRDEMRQTLWPADTFVDFEHSLNSAIKRLRAALGDSPENPRYVETIPRVGYRFIAPVQEVTLASEPVAEASPRFTESPAAGVPQELLAPQKQPRRVLLLVGGFSLLAIMAVATFVWWRFHFRPMPPGGRVTLAVLPFANLTGDPGQEYFSDGLTEEMIAQLGQVKPDRLSIISRTSVMRYKSSSESLPQIGSELEVQYILEGSVRSESGRVRIIAQLVRVKDQTPLWSREYDRELAGLLTLQHEVAREVADEIQVALGGAEPKTVAAASKSVTSPNSYEAYDLYLQGRYYWNKRSKDGFERAANYFQQAIARDPNYARAYAGLSDTFALMSSWSMGSPDEFMPKARAAALRAVQIDEGLAEAHTSLALVAENYDYDWQTAEREFKRAIQLDPGYATAHQWYAECLSWQGRFTEALAESDKARQLDPLSLIIAADHGAILYYSRQYDHAIEQFRAVQAMDPNSPRVNMVANAYVEKGMFTDARKLMEQWHHSDGTPTWEAQAFLYSREGQCEQAARAMKKWEEWHRGHRVPVMGFVPMAYVAMAQNDKAIAFLQEAYAEHSPAISEIKVSQCYDPLRSDPRFQDLLRRVGLTE